MPGVPLAISASNHAQMCMLRSVKALEVATWKETLLVKKNEGGSAKRKAAAKVAMKQSATSASAEAAFVEECLCATLHSEVEIVSYCTVCSESKEVVMPHSQRVMSS